VDLSLDNPAENRSEAGQSWSFATDATRWTVWTTHDDVNRCPTTSQ